MTPGDRVVIAIGPDDPFPWLVAYVAVHRAGAMAVPVNTGWPGRAPHHRRAMPTPPWWSRPAPDRGRTFVVGRAGGRADRRVLLDDDSSPALDPAQLGLGTPVDHSCTPRGRPVTPEGRLYTSGTTDTKASRPPPPLATGPAASWNGLGFMTCSPFSTTSGILLVDGPLRNGMSGWYLPRFDAGRWLELVEQDRPVAAFLVPAMAQLIVAHPRFADADLTSLAALTFGGAPMARATLRRLSRAHCPEPTCSSATA